MDSGRIVSFMERASFSLKMALIIWAHFWKALHMGKADIVTTTVVYMKGKLKTIKQMDWVFIMIHFKDMSTMESGKMTFPMAKAKKDFKMVLIMRVILPMGSSLDLVTMFVALAFIKESLPMETFMEMEYLPTLTIDNIMVNGKMG